MTLGIPLLIWGKLANLGNDYELWENPEIERERERDRERETERERQRERDRELKKPKIYPGRV